jgi:threonine dehydratase
VTVSAGNHAQGVAFTCNQLKRTHHVFLPEITPLQKVNRIKHFGGDHLILHLVGTTFDDTVLHAKEFALRDKSRVFVHPFDDKDVIIGQGTVGVEIFNDMRVSNLVPDVIVCPVGGGGLIAGVGAFSKGVDRNCRIYGVEAENANSMELSLHNNKITPVDNLDTFVDGASVRVVGDETFALARRCVDGVYVVENNHLCKTMIDVYQNDGIILEPAGVLSITGLDLMPKAALAGKNVVCITSGGNNDITRYPTILEKALAFQGLKHYFIVEFAQKPGELMKFMNNVLGANDDITRFEYLKKNNKDYGAVLIGIEVAQPANITTICENMAALEFNYTQIRPGDMLYSHLV